MKHILTAARLLLITTSASPSMAAVSITIAQQGPDVIARAVGTLNLPTTATTSHCGGGPGVINDGAISPVIGAFCIGSGPGFTYSIASGPTSFGTSRGGYADRSMGPLFGLNASLGTVATAGTMVDAISIWENTTLSELGLEPGPIGRWTLSHPAEGTISATATPAPVGLLGIGVLLAWSRALRRRIQKGQL